MQLNASERGTPILKTTILITVAGLLSFSTLAEEGREIVGQYTSQWSAGSFGAKGYSSPSASSGIIQGNGDFKAISGMTGESLTFHLLKNDFWRLKHGHRKTHPKVGAVLEISSDALNKPLFSATQQLTDGTTEFQLTSGDHILRVESVLFATENILMLTLSAPEHPIKVSVSLNAFPDELATHDAGKEQGIQWQTKAYQADISTAVTVAMAAGDQSRIQLKPGEKTVVFCSIASRFKHSDEKDRALSLVKDVDVDRLKNQHAKWWSNYWAKSWVRLSSLPDIEKHYYQSLYGMGAASRDPDFPPGIFGWETSDYSSWNGDYHMNYNHFAPFYALYAANRIEQADPQDRPLIDFMDRARDYAKVAHNQNGLLFPVGIGPKGIDTTQVTDPEDRHYKNKAHSEPYKDGKRLMLFGQKSNSAYAAINFIQRWRTTQDLNYAKARAYPFVRGVVDYWEGHLKFEDNRYVIYNDSIHEGSGENVNPILGLGLVPNAFKAALEMSEALNVDADRREKWEHILTHMSGWSFQEMKGKKIFRYSEKGSAWWKNNTLGIQHIYPANAITLDSDPKLLQIAKDTAIIRNGWKDKNGSNSFYPACVRVGIDPDLILKKLRMYTKNTRPNGMQKKNPHGIENFSTTPNTINMMMCMSVDYVLRIFPAWPKEHDAQFRNIRAWGAFLVSGEQKNGMIGPVDILSEKGKDCIMINPWPHKSVQLIRDGQPAEVLSGERFTFATTAGQRITILPHLK